MAWSLDSDRPIYLQLMDIIQMQIISGYYKAGDRLPSVRELAAEASVNPNTMQKAFVELERNGLIITQRTSGRTVTEDISMIEGIKENLAMEQLRLFLTKMKELGYERKDIVALLEHAAEEGNQ